MSELDDPYFDHHNDSRPHLALVKGEIAKPANLNTLRQLEAYERGYVAFNRAELTELLKVYGRMVAVGEWRDYAIDMLSDRAVFSIFRRASEMPLFRVEKNPKLAKKQGLYSVVAQTGAILKRGHDLAQVLKVIDKSLKIVERK